MHAAIEVIPALRCIAALRLADAASIGAKNKGLYRKHPQI